MYKRELLEKNQRCATYIDTDGIVTREYTHGKLTKQTGFLDANGYYRLQVWGKTQKVHRLVAQTFIPNPEKKETVNHINGIKTDNRVENLEWSTRKENTQHAFDIGLKSGLKGETNGMSKYSNLDKQAVIFYFKNNPLTGRRVNIVAGDALCLPHWYVANVKKHYLKN